MVRKITVPKVLWVVLGNIFFFLHRSCTSTVINFKVTLAASRVFRMRLYTIYVEFSLDLALHFYEYPTRSLAPALRPFRQGAK